MPVGGDPPWPYFPSIWLIHRVTVHPAFPYLTFPQLTCALDRADCLSPLCFSLICDLIGSTHFPCELNNCVLIQPNIISLVRFQVVHFSGIVYAPETYQTSCSAFHLSLSAENDTLLTNRNAWSESDNEQIDFCPTFVEEKKHQISSFACVTIVTKSKLTYHELDFVQRV